MQLRELGPPPAVLPPGYDANAQCEFHSGAPSHSVEKSKELKYKVQELIESKAITFAPNGLNMNNNPILTYNKPAVNMMEVEEERKMVPRMDELKTPMIHIKKQLLMNRLSPICNASCERYLNNSQYCDGLKMGIQELMNHGITVAEHLSTIEDVATLEILYDQVQPLEIPYDLSPMTISVDPVVPLTIKVPTHFLYGDTKAVLWSYDSTIYMHGQKVQEEPLAIKEPTINITGTAGVTRSGRIFALVPPTIDNGGTASQDKGKQIERNQ